MIIKISIDPEQYCGWRPKPLLVLDEATSTDLVYRPLLYLRVTDVALRQRIRSRSARVFALRGARSSRLDA